MIKINFEYHDCCVLLVIFGFFLCKLLVRNYAGRKMKFYAKNINNGNDDDGCGLSL